MNPFTSSDLKEKSPLPTESTQPDRYRITDSSNKSFMTERWRTSSV